MKNFKNIVIIATLLLVTLNIHAQTSVSSNTHITTTGQYVLSFFDTEDKQTVTVICEYKSDQKDKEYTITIEAIEDAEKKDKEKKKDSFYLNKTANYYVFESEFNRVHNKIFEVNKAVSSSSIQEIYRMVWNINHPGSDGTEAGVLQFNKRILVFDESTRNYLLENDHLQRKMKIDDLVSNKIIVVESAVKNARTELDNLIGKYNIDQDEVKKIVKKDTLSIIKIDTNYTKDSIILKNIDQFSKAISDLKTAQKQELKAREDTKKAGVYEITAIELQFERGFLEKVKVIVNYKNAEYIFENIYAIGFSSTLNFKRLSETKLYIRNSRLNNAPYIYLSDIFRNYDNRLDNYTRDYSPADTTFKINPNTMHEIILRREKYVNLFDAKIYTDLVGTNPSKPNGLIQAEISKRFNINTKRLQIGSTRSDWGYFGSFELWGAVNKIEQNNRELTLSNANVSQNGVLVSPNYASNLDFTRYENYSLGADLNYLLFDRPDQKFIAYADFGLKYGHVLLNDSVMATSGLIKAQKYYPEAHIVTIRWPRFTLELLPEKRINLKFSYAYNTNVLFSNNSFKQVMSYEKSEIVSLAPDKKARGLNQYEVFVRIMPNAEKNNQFFVRFRFFTQRGDANTSFSQFQIGYAYNWAIKR